MPTGDAGHGPYHSTTELARRLGVATQTIRRTLERHDLPHEVVERGNAPVSFRIPEASARRIAEELGRHYDQEQQDGEWGADDEVALARHQMATARAERDALEDQLEEERAARRAVEQRLEVSELRRALQERDVLISSLTARVTEVESSIRSHQADNERLRADHAAQVAGLEAENEQLRAELAREQLHVEHLRADHADALARLAGWVAKGP